MTSYTSLQKAEMSLTDPLQYWKQESRFPLLKATAKKYLSAPPGSVRSERVFSTCSNVLSQRRNRLKPEMSEKLVFLHDNLGFVKNIK